MPVSKHRKKPFRTRVEKRRREKVLDVLSQARRLIYDRALPEKQGYPPIFKGTKSVGTSKPIVEATKHSVGSVVTLSGNRKYEVQRDGSWKALNKPISRVKKMRMEFP